MNPDLGKMYFSYCYLCLQFELSIRLDYLWKLRAQQELTDMEELQENNRQLIRNILPDHVAKHYMLVERNHEVTNISLIVLDSAYLLASPTFKHSS